MGRFREYLDRRKNKNDGIGGDVVDAAQQGIIQTGSDIASFFGAESLSNSLGDWAQEQTDTMSDEGRRAVAKRLINDDLSIGEGMKDWRTWLLTTANIIGGMAVTGGGAGAVGKGVAMLGKAAKAGKAGTIAGHTSNLGANAFLNAAAGTGGQASAVEKDVMALSFADLKGSPEFAKLAIEYSDQGLSDSEALSKAQADIAKRAGDSVRGDFSIMAVNGIGGMVGDQAMGKLIKGTIGRTIKGAMIKGLVAESSTEAAQDMYSKYAGNVEKAEALGVEGDPMEGVLASGVESLLLGGTTGAGIGAVGGGAYKLKRRSFEKQLSTIITPEVIAELQVNGAGEVELKEQLMDKARNAAISRGFDLNHAQEIADNAINYAFGVSGSADQNYTAEPQSDTEPGETQQTPTQEAPAQQPPVQDIPPQQQEPPQQADLEFTQQAFDSAKPSDLTIDLQAAIGEMKAELDADRSNERARSAKQDLERYLSLLPNASNDELETTRNIAKRIVNDYWGIVDEVEAEVQQKAPDQQPAMQDTPPAAMGSGRGLTFETASTQLGEAIDRGELAFVDEAAQQDARFADGLRAAMEISPAAVLEVARLRKAGQMSEDQAISALQRIINSVQKPDDQLTPDERELELRAERNRELAHRRAQELEEGVDPGKYQGRGFQYQKDQAFTSGARAEPTPSGERSINEPFVTGLEDQRVQDAPQVEFDRWSDVQEGDQDVDARDYDSPYTDRPQTKEVEQDTVFQQREAGDRQPSPERTTEDWLSDFRGQPGGILKDPSLPSVSGSSERIKKKRRKEQDAEKSAILDRAEQSEKNEKTASEVSTEYIPNKAMQDAIVDAAVVDKQKAGKREEAAKSELRDHEKEVTTLLTSEIFNNMIDGKPELAKANRKWALKKALKALNSVIDSDHSRAKALVTKLDKLYRKESKGKWGIMAVAGGSRSNLGKRIDALLSGNATPPDGSGPKKTESKPEPTEKSLRTKSINQSKYGQVDNKTTEGKSPKNIRFSKTSLGKGKGLSPKTVTQAAGAFLNEYRGMKDVNLVVVPGQDDLERVLGFKPDSSVKGAWISGTNTVVLVAENLNDAKEARKVLRHELIAHNGLYENLSEKEMEALTKKVMSLRNNKSASSLFREVEKNYRTAPDEVKAEEVIAKLAETESGMIGKLADRVMTYVMGALRRSGFLSSDTVSLAEIRHLINQADKDLRNKDGTRNTRRFGRVSFSKTNYESVEDILAKANSKHFKAVKSALKKGADALGADKLKQSKYGLLTLRQIAEVGEKYLGTALGDYVSTINELQASQNDIVSNVIEQVEDLRKWSKGNKQESDRLWSMMHRFTLENVDPDVPYQDLTDILTEEAQRLERRLRSTGGDKNAHIMKELESTRKELKNEPKRRKAHARLKVQFDKLPDSTKKRYRQVRDHYIRMREEMKNALMERITDDVMDNKQKSALHKKIRQDNERAKRGLYVPLSRYGEYWINAIDKRGESGERYFFMYETQAELEVARDALKKAGFEVTSGQKLSQNNAIDGASIGFVSDIMDELKSANINDKAREGLTDSIYQLYLNAMPDRSLRRSFIHRKGVAGFSEDAIRAMADNGVKQARQQARLQFDGKLLGIMDQIKKKAEMPDNIEGHRIYNEMLKRHGWVMNPKRSPLAQRATSIGFTWMLGLSPAAALVNLTQIAQVAIPVIGAKYGVVKTSREMLTASREFMTAFPASTKGDPRLGVLGNVLEGDELDALKQAIRTGTIDVTQAADLMGLAENPSAQYDGKWHKAMNVVGWAFHKAEVFNREVTFIAAYRLAKQNPKLDHKGAIDEAIKMTWDSHFDYGSLNRARFMQSDLAAVALQFKQYSQNMTYYLFKSLFDSVRGETPEVKRRAAKQLLWTMGLTFGIGGMSALPLWAITQSADLAMAAAEGLGIADDEEPWDSETELKKMLSDYLGQELSQMVFYGTSPSISGRIGLNDLWVREPWSDEPDNMYTELLLQAVGPVFGGIFFNALRGLGDMAEGQTWRGAENMLPKWSKDLLKAVRYLEEEGITNKRGDYVLDEVAPFEVAAQALGFTPSRYVLQSDQNSALKEYEQTVKKRRSSLLAAYWMAYRTRDYAELRELRREIAKFNRSRWGRAKPITQKHIQQSIRRRKRDASNAESGARYDARYRRLLEESNYWG